MPQVYDYDDETNDIEVRPDVVYDAAERDFDFSF